MDIEDSFSISSELSSIIWDLSPIVIALVNEEGRFLYINRKGQEFLEYTEAELKEKKWQDITHPEDLSADLIMHKVLKEGKQHGYKICKRYITKSGRIVWGNLTVHMAHGMRNKMILFLSQVVPLDAGSGDSMRKEKQDVIDESTSIPEKKSTIEFGYYVKKNFTGIISLVFVVISAIYVFSGDLGANKQKIIDMENRMEKFEKNMDDVKERTNNIDKNVANILIEIKRKEEVGE